MNEKSRANKKLGMIKQIMHQTVVVVCL